MEIWCVACNRVIYSVQNERVLIAYIMCYVQGIFRDLKQNSGSVFDKLFGANISNIP